MIWPNYTMDMNDERVVNLAKILVEYSLEIEKDHKVLITGPADTKPLVLAVYKECLLRGAHPWQRITFPETEAIYYQFASTNQLDFLLPVDMDVLRGFDRLCFIRSETNTSLLNGMDSAKIVRRRRTIGPAHALMKTKRWCATFFPSDALAERANMPLNKFEDSFFSIVNQDWTKIDRAGRDLAKILNKTNVIKIEGKDTDLEFSIKNRTAVVGSGRFNMPDGEVYTSPVENSVQGRVLFDLPVDFEGHQIRDAFLEFEAGKVVNFGATEGESTLSALLAADEGASRLGEFAIGINYAMTNQLGHIALDEKIGGTCHLAIGFSPPDTGGVNKSAIHFDLLKDLRDHGRILGNELTICENGKHFN